MLAGSSWVSRLIFQVFEALAVGAQNETFVGGVGNDGGEGLGVGGEGWRCRRLNVRPSAKAIASAKRNIRPRIMLHFLVKILCGLAAFGSLDGVFRAVSLVRGDLNIPPDDMLMMAVIRFDSRV